MTDHPPAALPWTRDLFLRMREHFWLKFIGTVAWVWVFFIGYFHLLRNPAHPVAVMPLTPIDLWVPFQPGWLLPYLSLWVYVGIAPGLQRGLGSLLAYGFWSAALCLAGLGLFWLWPTQIPPMPVPAGAPGFALLQGIDAAGNACPSMHVAISIFTAVWLEHLLRRTGAPAVLRLLNIAWFMAIAYSTLAVRQHVLWDVLAGAALGAVFAAASLRWRPAEPPVAAK